MIVYYYVASAVKSTEQIILVNKNKICSSVLMHMLIHHIEPLSSLYFYISLVVLILQKISEKKHDVIFYLPSLMNSCPLLLAAIPCGSTEQIMAAIFRKLFSSLLMHNMLFDLPYYMSPCPLYTVLSSLVFGNPVWKHRTNYASHIQKTMFLSINAYAL